MADIAPFSAYRYNLERVRLADVVTQPYDKITPVMQERYLRSGPYNLIAVEKGKAQPGDDAANNVYTRAEIALKEWIVGGILVRDSSPGIYVYSQEYTVPGTAERRTRRGFIALGRVEDYSAGVVFRHEYTLAGPKADRLELLRHTKTHTGQLFMLYTDPDRRVDALLDATTRGPAPAEAHDEYGVVHRMWPVFDREVIAQVKSAMAAQKLVIADGHHRYETALAYRNECREKSSRAGAASDPSAPYEYAMMTFFNTRGEGLLILPTHRMVANLAGFDVAAFRAKMAVIFDGQDYTFGSEAARAVAYDRFQRDLAAHGRKGRAIGMYAKGEFTLFTLRPEVDLAALLPDSLPAQRELDVVLLHRILLERGLGITPAAVVAESNITYEREMTSAIAAVDDGRAQLSFLLNPVGVEQTTEMALGGEVMPQKSTDFYPKLLSGLTLYRLN
jgi:uncharacterized protein (DUF1015 family)